MSKDKFLQELRDGLRDIPESERNDILSDYEEHFRAGHERGKAEKQIATSLGDPKTIAKQFRAGYSIKRAEATRSASNIIKAVLATLSLGFFNVVFVIGPFAGLVGVLVGLYATAIGFVISGISIPIGLAFPMLISVNFDPVFAVFAAVAAVAVGLLMLIGCWYLTKLFYKATLSYLKWNINIISR
jgi:uncharacterized membrane protein